MKYFLAFLALIFSCSVFGQGAIYLTTHGDTLRHHVDSLKCSSPCGTVTAGVNPALLSATTSYSVTAITYAPYSLTAGTPATVSGSSMLSYDDNFGDLMPLPFTFSFFGVCYNNLVIGTNGNICFNTSSANTGDPWSISGALPGSNCAATENCIMGPWNDLYPPDGGTINYAVYGTAPNRVYVVTWNNVHLFISGTCSGSTTQQVVIHETTNIIDVFITSRVPCTAWNSGYAVTAIENAAGTVFVAAPGENGTTFTATDEAWRFTPSAPPSPWVLNWYDATGRTLVSASDSVRACPTVAVTYIVKATNPGACTPLYDTVTFIPIDVVPTRTTNPTVCGECNGTITLLGLAPLQNAVVSYQKDGVAQPTFRGTVGADSTLHLTGLCAGAYSNMIVTVGSCTAFVNPVTLVNPPPFPANFYLTEKLGCNGDQVSTYNTSAPLGYNTYWNWGDGSGTDSSLAIPTTHLYNDNAVGYVATYTVTLTYESYHNPACATTKDTVISFNHPISASFTEDNTNVCLGVPINFTNSSIANGPTYVWDFGDGTSDTATNPTHNYAVGGNYTIQLVTEDTIGCYSTPATFAVEVIQVDVHVSTHDTSVCLNDSTHLTSFPVVIPASVPYTISWTPGNSLGDVTSPTPGFFGIGTFLYTVEVSTTAPITCMASDNETVISYPPVTLSNLTANPTVIPYGSSIQLNADGAVYYNWKPDNGTLNSTTINDPVATPTDTVTTYTVYGMNLYGCLDSAKITLNLDIDALADMPTAFSPDGDGLNDVFRVTHLKYKHLVAFRIYNRWGEEVFSTINPEQGWDGKYKGVPQDIGVYNYQVIVGDADGTQKVYKGSVTLLR